MPERLKDCPDRISDQFVPTSRPEPMERSQSWPWSIHPIPKRLWSAPSWPVSLSVDCDLELLDFAARPKWSESVAGASPHRDRRPLWRPGGHHGWRRPTDSRRLSGQNRGFCCG